MADGAADGYVRGGLELRVLVRNGRAQFEQYLPEQKLVAAACMSDPTNSCRTYFDSTKVGLAAIAKRRHEQEKYVPQAAWELDRALGVQALADACAWAWEREGLLPDGAATPEWGSFPAGATVEWHRVFKADTGVHADALLEHDPGAVVDALCLVSGRDRWERSVAAYTMAHLKDAYLPALREAGSGCTHAMERTLRQANWI